MDVGSLADWLSAAGGLLAVGAAVTAYRISSAQLDVERTRDERADKAEQRAQAEKVFAIGVKTVDTAGQEWWGLNIFNGSDQPIFDIAIDSVKADGSETLPTLELGALPPGGFIVHTCTTHDWQNPVRVEDISDTIHLITKGQGAKMVQRFEFRDARRRRWEMRQGSSQLTLLAEK